MLKTRAQMVFPNITRIASILAIFMFSSLLLFLGGCTPLQKVKVKVVFEVNGGSAIDPVEVTSGELLPLPKPPTKAGHEFENWYKDAGLTMEFYPTVPIVSSITLYAKWKAIFYSITFDPKGGSSVDVIAVQKEGALKLPTPPTKYNQVFGGWFTDEELKNKFDESTAILKSIILYAKWLDAFTVTFNTNGGTEIPAELVVKNATLATLPANPTREGQIFKGWFKNEELTTKFVQTEPITKNIILYAKWQRVNSFEITFDTMGGNEIPAEIVDNGSTLVKFPQPPTQAGKKFLGWFVDVGFTTKFDINQPITQNITLFAKWENHLVITFDTNGGGNKTEVYLFDGETLTEAQLTPPTKNNSNSQGSESKFQGWFVDADLITPFVKTRPITQNITLFAKWEDPFRVTFDTKGGSGKTPAYVFKVEGALLTRAQLFDPTRIGYLFVDWFEDDNEWTIKFDATKPITKDITLYAKWEVARTVSFESNGGTTISPETLADGSLLVLPIDPILENKAFDGWFGDNNLMTRFDATKPITKDTTLYAKWKSIFKVTFDTKGGSAKTPIDVVDGKSLTTTQLAPPTYANHDFDGWFEDQSFTIPFVETKLITADIVLYAKWIDSRTVSFDSNGGTVISPQSVLIGSLLTLPPEPTLANKVFDGWFVDAGLMTQFDATQPITKDITLYAKWRDSP